MSRKGLDHFAYEFVPAPPGYPGKTYFGKSRRIYAHHLAWWQRTGQAVPHGCILFFVDGDPKNCAFENLSLASCVAAHNRLKPGKRAPAATFVCAGCKVVVTRPFTERVRQRSFFTCGKTLCMNRVSGMQKRARAEADASADAVESLGALSQDLVTRVRDLFEDAAARHVVAEVVDEVEP